MDLSNPAHLEATRLLALFYAELGELASKFATAIDKHDYDYLVELMNLDLFKKLVKSSGKEEKEALWAIKTTDYMGSMGNPVLIERLFRSFDRKFRHKDNLAFLSKLIENRILDPNYINLDIFEKVFTERGYDYENLDIQLYLMDMTNVDFLLGLKTRDGDTFLHRAMASHCYNNEEMLVLYRRYYPNGHPDPDYLVDAISYGYYMIVEEMVKVHSVDINHSSPIEEKERRPALDPLAFLLVNYNFYPRLSMSYDLCKTVEVCIRLGYNMGKKDPYGYDIIDYALRTRFEPLFIQKGYPIDRKYVTLVNVEELIAAGKYDDNAKLVISYMCQ